jgi:hypothetical protein
MADGSVVPVQFTFDAPQGVAFAVDGSLLVLEGGNPKRVQVISPNLASKTGTIGLGAPSLETSKKPVALAAGRGGASGSNIFIAITGELCVWGSIIADLKSLLMDLTTAPRAAMLC